MIVEHALSPGLARVARAALVLGWRHLIIRVVGLIVRPTSPPTPPERNP